MIYCILFLNVGGVFIEYCNGLRFDIVIMDKKIKKKIILNFLKNRKKEVFDGIVLFIVVILSLFGFVSIINF